MKSFKSYLVESEQTYKFRIKMAEKGDDEIMNALETALEKYEVASISKPKKTPIQEHPMDFQTLNNAEVFIMDAELKYPVTAHQLYEYITQTVGVPASHLVVINSDHPEEIAREEAIKEDGYIDIESLNTVAISGLDSYHTSQRLSRLSYAKPSIEQLKISLDGKSPSKDLDHV